MTVLRRVLDRLVDRAGPCCCRSRLSRRRSRRPRASGTRWPSSCTARAASCAISCPSDRSSCGRRRWPVCARCTGIYFGAARRGDLARSGYSRTTCGRRRRSRLQSDHVASRTADLAVAASADGRDAHLRVDHGRHAVQRRFGRSPARRSAPRSSSSVALVRCAMHPSGRTPSGPPNVN